MSMSRSVEWAMRGAIRGTFVAALGVVLIMLAAPAAPVCAQTAGTQGTGSETETAAPRRTLIRFLTDNDYPPFNYVEEDGTLTGFNIDVARAVCLQLAVTCDIQTRAWDDLLPALGRGDADAVIASIAISPASLKDADFTDRYYSTPARFAALKSAPEREVTPEGLESRKIGVVTDSAHEAYLQAFFRDSVVVGYGDEEALRQALVSGEVELVFGDGIGLMFWLNGTGAAGCCEFRGGPFQDPRYFGDGVGIAVHKGDMELKAQINQALADLRQSGRLEELYLRHFPLRIY
ncbi:MAG: transporter substrate-binding domain-containing protein [Hyphomicrobiaceae bacterium]